MTSKELYEETRQFLARSAELRDFFEDLQKLISNRPDIMAIYDRLGELTDSNQLVQLANAARSLLHGVIVQCRELKHREIFRAIQIYTAVLERYLTALGGQQYQVATHITSYAKTLLAIRSHADRFIADYEELLSNQST